MLNFALIDFKRLTYDMLRIRGFRKFSLCAEKLRPRSLIKNSMPSHVCNNQQVTKIIIKGGVFQGNSYSYMLFAYNLDPTFLCKVNVHCELRKNGPRRGQLHFMDDLKLFAKTNPEIERLVETEQQGYRDRIRYFKVRYAHFKTGKKNRL